MWFPGYGFYSFTSSGRLWMWESVYEYTLLFFFFNYFFWLHCVACGILVPPSGIEPRPLSVKASSPNQWTTREFLP